MRVATFANKTKRERQRVLARLIFSRPAQGPDLVDRVEVPFRGISWPAERRPAAFKSSLLVERLDQLNEFLWFKSFLLEIL